MRFQGLAYYHLNYLCQWLEVSPLFVDVRVLRIHHQTLKRYQHQIQHLARMARKYLQYQLLLGNNQMARKAINSMPPPIPLIPTV